MAYIIWYLGIGIILLTTLFINQKIRRSYEPRSFHDILESTNPDRDKLSFKFLSHIAVPLLVLSIWPLAIFMIIQDYFQSKDDDGSFEPPVFAVKPEHLTTHMTRRDIELQEIIVDPLEAVPALPFGHLNSKWEKFIAAQLAVDEVWAFTADWETSWGGKELRQGYVLVRDGAPILHFLTKRQNLSDEK
jgi:hypothetical protein